MPMDSRCSETKAGSDGRIRLHEKSVLGLAMEEKSDIVFSVGLIEHFDAPRTRQAALSHFDVLRPGGTAIITFPTPTLLYRITRGLAEMFGMWQFPDERPLKKAEVLASVSERGEVLMTKILWPLILTRESSWSASMRKCGNRREGGRAANRRDALIQAALPRGRARH